MPDAEDATVHKTSETFVFVDSGYRGLATVTLIKSTENPLPGARGEGKRGHQQRRKRTMGRGNAEGDMGETGREARSILWVTERRGGCNANESEE